MNISIKSITLLALIALSYGEDLSNDTWSCPFTAQYQFTMPPFYDYKMPDPASLPLIVDVNFTVYQIYDIDDAKSDYKMMFYAFMTWKDSRIITDDCGGIIVNSIMENLYRPEFYFMRKKHLEISSDQTAINQFMVKDGKLLWVTFMDGTFTCEMTFEDFPFDNQYCYHIAGNLLADTRLVQFRSSYMIMDETQKVMAYHVRYVPLQEHQLASEQNLIGFNIHLRRRFMPYVYTYYAPSLTFVVLSWISFIVPPTVIPARLGFLVTLLLVQVNLNNTLQSSIGLVSNFNALGFFMNCCVSVIFGCILEYALLLHLRGKLVKNKNELLAKNKWSPKVRFCAHFPSDPDEFCSKMDGWAFVLFTTMFMIFAVCYGVHYHEVYYRDEPNGGYDGIIDAQKYTKGLF